MRARLGERAEGVGVGVGGEGRGLDVPAVIRYNISHCEQFPLWIPLCHPSKA